MTEPQVSLGFWTQEVEGEILAANTQARYAMYHANKGLAKLNYQDDDYSLMLEIFDQAAIKYHKGRYYHYLTWHRLPNAEADIADWSKARKAYAESEFIAQTLYDAIISGNRTPLSQVSFISEKLEIPDGTEVTFAGEVPIMTSVCPVVILSGSDYDMGYQYAQQLTQIYGPWLLEQRAGRNFTKEQIAIMGKWEEQIKQHAPEMIDFFKGWVAGANADGIPMSYNDVLELWVGPWPPATERQFFVPQHGDMCSGLCAWGSATTDGKLVSISSTDHECAPMATIVAFPETGNNFIYSPFSARGTIDSMMTDFYFSGHPGMNNKGLAYVHHGGVPTMSCEPREDWGYGLKQGVFTLHTLRFADNVKEAEDMVLSVPIGDVGMFLGSVGTFWADSSGAFVAECRKDPVVIRRAGDMGETDFLYATNNLLSRDLADCLPPPIEALSWDPHAGWYTLNPIPLGGTIWESMARLGTKCSHCRNLYVFHMLDQYKGKVDLEFMKMLYRQKATLPPGTLEENEAAYMAGAYWPCSVGHRMNAFVSAMKPDDGDEGLYYGCIGPAARGTEPMMPGSFSGFFYYVDSPHAFWELKLASTPANVTIAARQRAEADMNTASAELAKLKPKNSASTALNKILVGAEVDYNKGEHYEALAESATGNDSICNWGKAVRAFTRSQVRARQVYNALVPPPDSPDDLGLKPFVWPEPELP
jgi:hypothetical protein